MPPLPAIRTAASPASWTSLKLYGDEQFTNFFRRLTFSPDGALLLTPAGQFEDPTFSLASRPPSSTSSDGKSKPEEQKTTSSVYIYSRASFARPPVAHLPGHKTASVVVKFSPMLYELRSGVRDATDVPKINLQKGEEQVVSMSLGAPSGSTEDPPKEATPTKSPMEGEEKASVWKLPYRMLFAVATQDTVVLYDTQQAGPLAMFANLHYASFTDVAWAPDGQSLIMSSSDGYCSIAVFDDPLPLYERQQHHVQMAAIAEHHSTTSSADPMAAASQAKVALPWPVPPKEPDTLGKRDSTTVPTATNGEEERGREENAQPQKKKRRIELKHIGGLDTV